MDFLVANRRLETIFVLELLIKVETQSSDWHYSTQVLQLTKEANRPMERNLSSAAGGSGGTRMAGNRTKSDSAASNPSAPVNFIPINAAEACDDNLCFNGGFCDPLSLKCRCRGHFIGKFSRQIRACKLFLFFLVELQICFKKNNRWESLTWQIFSRGSSR